MKKILLSIFVIISLFCITGCVKVKEYDSEIESFSYQYGSYNGGYYKYEIDNSGDKATFIATGYNGVNNNTNKEIDKSEVNKLSKIIYNNKIYEWDGFGKNNNRVLDGYSFSLKVKYKNGKSITASGYMDYPNNYNTGHKKIASFLESIK